LLKRQIAPPTTTREWKTKIEKYSTEIADYVLSVVYDLFMEDIFAFSFSKMSRLDGFYLHSTIYSRFVVAGLNRHGAIFTHFSLKKSTGRVFEVHWKKSVFCGVTRIFVVSWRAWLYQV
jgi:hypothetical protein